MKSSMVSRLATYASLLAVAAIATACATVPPEGGAGLKLVTPLKPAAAVCLAETDPDALKRALGNDEIIRRTR